MLRRSAACRNLGRGDEYVRSVFNAVAPKYDLMNDVMSLGVHRCWKNTLVEQCVRPQKGARFLDVAGGTGDVAFRIVECLRRFGSVPEPSAVAAAAAAAQAAAAHAAAVNAAAAAAATAASDPTGAAVAEAAAAAAAVTAAQAAAAVPPAPVTVFDINREMLNEGRARAAREGYTAAVDWVEGSAEALPFPDASFDSYTVAFGIRNFGDRPRALREAHRVLRCGGVLNVLEFSKVTNPLLAAPYAAYSDLIIPAAGQLLAGSAAPYQYLVDSIRAFPDQETFARTIADAGFGYVRYQNLSMGIACIHTAVRTTPHPPTPPCA